MSYQALLFCPDEKTARVVTQVLTELEFSVELSNEPFAAVKKMMAKQYDAIVVDCDNEQNAALIFKSARNSTTNQSSLAVAVVEGQAGVAKAFRIGANLVLTKPVNVEQSKGTLRVARGLLKKAESNKAAASSTSTSSSIPRPVTPSFSAPGPVTPPAHIVAPASAFASASFSGKMGGIPVPRASSTFEVDQDATPQRAPTEAAFLESIPKAAAPRTNDNAKTESPWLQVSPPARESAKPAITAAPVRHPFNSGISAGQGTAVAPAREPESAAAKEFRPLSDSGTVKAQPSAQAAPSTEFSEAEVLDTLRKATAASSDAKSSKITLIAAVVILAAGAAGYYGWTRMHTSNAAPTQSTAQPVAAATQAVPTPAPTTNSPEAEAITTDLNHKTNQPLPKLTQSQPDEPRAKSAAGKPAPDEIVVVENSATAPADAKPATPKRKSEVLTVKADSASDESSTPPALQVASASDQTLAGLIPTTSNTPQRAPQMLKVSQGISEGILVKKVAPVYPARALQMRIQGTVQILASVGKNGSITAAKVIKGDPSLGDAALTAVRQWKYKPYTLNGQPVEVQTQVQVNFKLP